MVSCFRKFFFAAFILTSLSVSVAGAFAQNGSIRGFLYDAGNGEPVIFATVFLRGTSFGCSSDVNGFFSITRIPAGSYTLVTALMGYDSLSSEIVLGAGEIITRKLYLSRSPMKLHEVEISAEKQEDKTEVRMSVTKITPREIRQVPSFGGEADLAQYVQVLPGVVSTGDQGGQLYIRGGSPIQNKVLLDGMIIYNPFHSIGFFSVIDPDLIRNADIYTGGFGSQYGGRISSVMDITTRDGNKKRISGKMSSNPFTSKLLVEGPVSRAKNENEGTTSFIFSAKTSYLDKTSKFLYGYADTAGMPYSFSDFYGKVSLNGTNGSKLNVYGFNFSDKVRYQHISDLRWNSSGLGADFILIPGTSSVLVNGAFAYSRYNISLSEADGRPRSSGINGFNMNLGFTYYLGRDELRYGIETLGFTTDFDFFNYVGRRISQQENTTELGTFVTYRKVIRKLVLEPGIRMHYYASLDELSPEPRLGAKYNLMDKMRLKFSGGMYAQNLISSTSERDVVNLFYGFLSGSENIPSEFNGHPVNSVLQKARHAIAGIEYDLPKHFTLNVEAYIKDFTQLTGLNTNKLFEDDGDNASRPDSVKKDFVIETGNAKGIDILLKYDYKHLFLWGVYSLGFVTRNNGMVTYTPLFDRRHNVNLVASYTFGKDLNWETDVRWNYGSGFPFTQNAGFYEYLNFSDGIKTDYTSANGYVGVIYGQLNKGRLPDYHRLDIALKRHFELSKNSSLEVNASIINVYNRRNIFYINRLTGDKVYQLPILPSIGASLTF